MLWVRDGVAQLVQRREDPADLTATGHAWRPRGAMFEVYINGAMAYDLVSEPLITETIRSRKGDAPVAIALE